ncbi:hypothetical protein [Mycolicibacterium chitae]|nr:hypothetical protein [Mycolicibacterium chitae]MCV7104757.1 hypothetical protein [Mycolicibacterium chitae]
MFNHKRALPSRYSGAEHPLWWQSGLPALNDDDTMADGRGPAAAREIM